MWLDVDSYTSCTLAPQSASYKYKTYRDSGCIQLDAFYQIFYIVDPMGPCV
jgi:hypothetical protein